jgi:hypothetical protein
MYAALEERVSTLEKQAAQARSEDWPDDTETLGVSRAMARSGISKLAMFPSHVRLKKRRDSTLNYRVSCFQLG